MQLFKEASAGIREANQIRLQRLREEIRVTHAEVLERLSPSLPLEKRHAFPHAPPPA
jgi:hypothetical protein